LLLAIDWLLAIVDWLLLIGYCWLAIVVGYWLLIGYWLAIVCWKPGLVKCLYCGDRLVITLLFITPSRNPSIVN
jgi:hypothetical protein